MRLLLALTLLAAPAHADGRVPYPWLDHAPLGDDLALRVAPPAGTSRIPLAEGSFGDWLRHLPLLPSGEAVHLYDGRLKSRQDVHAAIVDLDVGTRDLQQCADAVMRLRAEYLFAAHREGEIRFHPDEKTVLAWKGGSDRKQFGKYLINVFAEAGTASLAAELPRPRPLRARDVRPGDVLIQGGSPGHALLVLDAADAADGKRWLMLGQSYMPAQQFHVVRNLDDRSMNGDPWFDADTLDKSGLQTPEWRAFTLKDVRRFN